MRSSQDPGNQRRGEDDADDVLTLERVDDACAGRHGCWRIRGREGGEWKLEVCGGRAKEERRFEGEGGGRTLHGVIRRCTSLTPRSACAGRLTPPHASLSRPLHSRLHSAQARAASPPRRTILGPPAPPAADHHRPRRPQRHPRLIYVCSCTRSGPDDDGAVYGSRRANPSFLGVSSFAPSGPVWEVWVLLPVAYVFSSPPSALTR